MTVGIDWRWVDVYQQEEFDCDSFETADGVRIPVNSPIWYEDTMFLEPNQCAFGGSLCVLLHEGFYYDGDCDVSWPQSICEIIL